MIDATLQLTVRDGQRRFALDIAFARRAPVLALYGPSGAGKSLALQAMAGLVPGTRGRLRIGDQAWLDSAAGIDLPPEQRGVGYLFQHYALFPHLSVRDNVAFGLGNWRRRPVAADLARVDALLERFGLAEMAGSRPATLSGGQLQRAALARALACQPRLLLLDEPFAALNPMLRRRLRDELAAARRDANVPMVLVTHDAEDLAALADEVLLIDEGRVRGSLLLDSDTQRHHLRDELQAMGWA